MKLRFKKLAAPTATKRSEETNVTRRRFRTVFPVVYAVEIQLPTGYDEDPDFETIAAIEKDPIGWCDRPGPRWILHIEGEASDDNGRCPNPDGHGIRSLYFDTLADAKACVEERVSSAIIDAFLTRSFEETQK